MSGQIDTRIYLVLLITAMAVMRVVKLSGRHFAWNAIPASISQDITVDLGSQSCETLPFERVRAHAWQLVCTITRHVRELGQGVIRGTWITMYEILRRRRRTRRHNCGKNAALPLLSSIKHQLIYERPDRKEGSEWSRQEGNTAWTCGKKSILLFPG